RLLRIPAVAHVRFPDNHAGYRWFFRPGFRLALFVSQALMSHALGEAAVLFDGKSTVLHDCVAPQPQLGDTLRALIRAELGIPEGRVAVAMTGQVAEVKGIW